MKKFICTVCGYVHEGDEAPEICPQCKQPKSKFKELVETEGALTFVDIPIFTASTPISSKQALIWASMTFTGRGSMALTPNVF